MSGSLKSRADVLLVERGLFDSRAKAQAAIAAGLVTADGRVVKKPSDMLLASAVIAASAAHPWVSRGGVKLEAALETFSIPVAGRTCLDVGSSTGGFTDVLIARGAARVYAVDTGRDQMAGRLAAHPNVTLMEGTDIRTLDPTRLANTPDLAVVDVSFIPLGLVLPAVAPLMAVPSDLVVLIKPQFEVGRSRIGKNGVVKDVAAREAVCGEVAEKVRDLGWTVSGTMESPITGGEGNVEYLLAARRIAA
ncbi:MAG: TlyA family RNA methyltransferase [Alphaproteobacteria bacterium]|jgi:23S rRNA (cytidine1920-2'-O)/16S rRNA (cytidine1409-2'-O)-methyltransferase